jgi:uncharacterized protein (TIGR03437 family)
MVSIWATGLGSVLDADEETDLDLSAGVPYQGTAALVSAPLTALINGQTAEVVSASLPEGSIGVYEVKIAVPADLASESKAELTIVQNGYRSNTVTFPLQ